MKSFIDYMKEINSLKEGHSYLRKTSKSEEKRLKIAKEKASLSSGNPSFERNNKKRNDLLLKIKEKRPLRRSEYISLYGYQAWLSYVQKHNLPETYKWADK
jgi:hypothetical protein